MSLSILPNVGKIIVEVEKEDSKTSGGIFIPDSYKTDGVKRGKVIAAGTPKMVNGQCVSMSIEVGDRVLFDPLGGTKLKVDGLDVLLMRSEDVLGKIA